MPSTAMHRDPLSADTDPVDTSFLTACCKYQLRKVIDGLSGPVVAASKVQLLEGISGVAGAGASGKLLCRLFGIGLCA